jgi:SAM-dependent methyltransferase
MPRIKSTLSVPQGPADETDAMRQARIGNAFADLGYLQSTIDAQDTKGLKCDYIDRWSRHYVHRYVTGRRVLEVGCGGGRNLFPLARNGREAWGIDIADKQVENARSAAARLGVGNVHFSTDPRAVEGAGIETLFTMWVLTLFSTDEAVVEFLRSYLDLVPSATSFVFFEQAARETYRVDKFGSFFKLVRSFPDYRAVFEKAGLKVEKQDILDEKGFGPLYRSFYLTSLYSVIPSWLNLNPLLFRVDRALAQRRLRDTFTDCVHVCSRR